MSEDKQLQIFLVFILILCVIAIIGIWESFVEPIVTFIRNSVSII